MLCPSRISCTFLIRKSECQWLVQEILQKLIWHIWQWPRIKLRELRTGAGLNQDGACQCLSHSSVGVGPPLGHKFCKHYFKSLFPERVTEKLYLRIWSFLISALEKIWRHFEILQKPYHGRSKWVEPNSSERSPSRSQVPCCSAVHFTLFASQMQWCWRSGVASAARGTPLVRWGWLPLHAWYTRLHWFCQAKAPDVLHVWLLDLCLFVWVRITMHEWWTKYFRHYGTIGLSKHKYIYYNPCRKM